MRIGTTATVDPAISRFHAVAYRPCRLDSPTGRVMRSGEFTMISGHRKLFQLATNENTASVAIAGSASGSTSRRNTVRCPAPSINAAPEAKPRERVAGHRARRDLQGGRHRGDAQAVEQKAPEREGARDLRVVAQLDRRRNELRRGHEQGTRRLERRAG